MKYGEIWNGGSGGVHWVCRICRNALGRDLWAHDLAGDVVYRGKGEYKEKKKNCRVRGGGAIQAK